MERTLSEFSEEMMIQRTSGMFEGEQKAEDRKKESTSKGLTWK